MTKSALQIARAAYQPKLPKALKGAVKVKEVNLHSQLLTRKLSKPCSLTLTACR